MVAHAQAQGAAVDLDGGWQSVNTVFTNAKAGMNGVDKARVQRIVHEMSKNSTYYANEQRKEAKVRAKIEQMKAQHAKLRPSDLALATAAADARLRQLEASRDLSRVFCHVDMDAFYAACEELADPSLASKPVAVGGIGMLFTANYVARSFGVRSAMPGFIAKRLCPELQFVRPDFTKYTAAAEQARAVFAQVDPSYVSHGLDEAYLDATEYCERTGLTPDEVAAELRRKVREATGLTCSVGIASNPMLAKVCSDLNKPDGQFRLPNTRDQILRFLASLPVRKVPGVGKVTEQMLRTFGVEVVEDLHTHRGLLHELFSPISFDFFMHTSLGLYAHAADGHGRPEHGRKGISCERTFAAISTRAEIEAKAALIAGSLAADMAAEGLAGKCVTLKLKAATFEVRTRAVTLAKAVSTKEELLAVALRLLAPELPITIRLLGLRVSAFDSPPPPSQLTLESFIRSGDAAAAAAGRPAPAQSYREGSGRESDEFCCEARCDDSEGPAPLGCNEDRRAAATSTRPGVVDPRGRQARAYMGVWDSAVDCPAAALDRPGPALEFGPHAAGVHHSAPQGAGVDAAARAAQNDDAVPCRHASAFDGGLCTREDATALGDHPFLDATLLDRKFADMRSDTRSGHGQGACAGPQTGEPPDASPAEPLPGSAVTAAWSTPESRGCGGAAPRPERPSPADRGGSAPPPRGQGDVADLPRAGAAGLSGPREQNDLAGVELPASAGRPPPAGARTSGGCADEPEAQCRAGEAATSQALDAIDGGRSRDEAAPCGVTGGVAVREGSEGGVAAPSCLSCGECSALVPAERWQEHQDWHVALKMDLRINGTGAAQAQAQGGCKKSRGGADAGGGRLKRGGGREKGASASAAKRRKSADAPKAVSLERFGFARV